VRLVNRMLSRVIFVLLICLSSARVYAQGEPWGLFVLWPQSAVVGSNITYRILVTNESTILVLNQLVVANEFSAPVQFVESTTMEVSRTVNPNNVTFNVTRQINPGQSFSITLTVRATSVGTLTNNVTGDSTGTTVRPMVTAVTTVTAPVARSDLTVSITSPPPPVFVNDWVPYTITVNRSGPDPLSGVFVTNVVPPGAIVRGYSPSNAVTVNGQQVIFNLGTMSLASTQVNLTIQPTTTNLVLAAIVGTTGLETNTANNAATNTLSVLQPVLGDLMAEAIPGQVFNPQNALFEQLVRVTYTGTSSVPSARVILSNFNHKVVNAVGTNDGHPFVVHAGALSTNQPTVDLVLEYFFPDRLEKDDPELITYSAGTIDLTPPTGTNVAVTNIVLSANELATDRVLLRFPATPGGRYAITYMTNMSSPARKAMPLLVAQANYVHWIDYGPPKTISRPFFGELYATNDVIVTNMMDTNVVVTTNMIVTTNLSMRFYQAIQVP
jgi:uncharacterized repeat protein (TIGR01451 family)